MRLWLCLAGLNGAIAVMAAAYGWHALDGNPFFNRAATFQIIHAVALIGVALLSNHPNIRPLPVRFAGILLQTGIIFFSGSLYKLALTGSTLFPGAAPTGGFCLIAGWLCFCWAGMSRKA